MQNFYGNTLVCAGGVDGRDDCHIWFNKDRSYTVFDELGARTGHYDVSPVSAGGHFSVCIRSDTSNVPTPPELDKPMPSDLELMDCKIENFHSVCKPAPAGTPRPTSMTKFMGPVIHAGNCYPMDTYRKVGDHWFEYRDPIPTALGRDQVLIVPGRR